jgi:hypothetical protein
MLPTEAVQTTFVPERVKVPVAVDPTGVTDARRRKYPLPAPISVMSARSLFVAALGAVFERARLMPSAFRLWTFSDRS